MVFSSSERSNFNIVAYTDSIKLQAQQMDSRLEQCCIPHTFKGNEDTLDWLEPTEVTPSTGINEDLTAGSGLSDQVGRQRRGVQPAWYKHHEFFDPREDLLTNHGEPTAEYGRNVIAAFMRRLDKVILKAYFDTVSINGTAGQAYGSTNDPTPLPTGTYDTDLAIDDDILGGTPGTRFNEGFGLTPEKHILAVRYIKSNDVGMEGDLYTVCHPNQMHQVLGAVVQSTGDLDPRVTSADYNTRMALEAGEVKRFMGTTFVQTTQVGNSEADGLIGTTASGASNGRYVYVKSSDALACYKAPSGMEVRSAEAATVSFSTLLFHRMAMAGLRTEAKRIIRIQCTDD